jgi:hypothetical protein
MKNPKLGTTVYQVKTDCNSGQTLVHKGFVSDPMKGSFNKCKVMWVAPDTSYKGSTTEEYRVDVFETSSRAINQYLRRAKLNLSIQALDLEEE